MPLSASHAERSLRALRTGPPRLRAEALAAALAHAPADERDRLAEELLDAAEQQGGEAALTVLLRHWGRLSPLARRATIADAAHRFAPALRTLARADDDRDRRAAWRVAAACVTQREAHATRDEPPLRALIDELIAEGLQSYAEHRLGAVLDAAVALAHSPGPRLRAVLADHDQPAHMALRAAARNLPSAAAPRLIQWLAVPALAPLAAERLETIADPAAVAEALAPAHLLPLRAPAGRARRLRRPEAPALRVLADPGAPTDSARAALRWLRHGSREPARLIAALRAAAAHAEPRIRFEAARLAAAAPPSAHLDALLASLMLDGDPRVSWCAARPLLAARSRSRRAALREAFEAAAERAEPRVAAAAAVALAADSLAAAVRRGAPMRTLAALLRARPHDASRQLLALLESGGRSERLIALELTRGLAPSAPLRDAAIALTRCPDPFVVSKAVPTAARLAPDRRAELVRAALEHADPRVRASAVEAAACAPLDPSLESALTRDPHPRIRALAIRRLALTGQAAAAEAMTLAMLKDERPDHRLSALWLAARLRLTGAAAVVRRLAREEADGRARVRAAGCARLLAAWENA